MPAYSVFMDYLKVKEIFAEQKKIVITTHRGPDGDAMGSSLGLYHFLKAKGQEDVNVVVPDAYADFLNWLPGNDQVVVFESKNKERAKELCNNADVIFSLDYNALHRMADLGDVVADTKAIKIMIDHHRQPDDYAAHMLSDVEASSTCELIHRFIKGWDPEFELSKEIADCLYTGIVTDTGSFRFNSTTAETHHVTAALLDAGTQPDIIYNNVFDTNSLDRMKLVGFALTEKLEVVESAAASFIALTYKELKRFNFRKGDTEGLVNYGLAINGMRFTAFFRESEEGYIKISLRSKGSFDVNQLARKYFNGGGHCNAAGGRSDLSIEETIAKFKSIVEEYRTELALHE